MNHARWFWTAGSGQLPLMMGAFRFYTPVQIVPNAAARMQ